MTDGSCLQFKAETNGVINGVITINNERYLAFGLKGNIGEIEYIYTSMDFGWTWHINETDGDYIFTATNDNANFIWIQRYYFYSDPKKRMKVEHYLENNWDNLTNVQMYYLSNVLETDTIEYNETSYLVSDYIGLHKQGDFNNLQSKINFNAEFDFRFDDLISDGFNINEFYIGSGGMLDRPNINITAIGFTKNNGVFNKGTNVTVDPTFSTSDIGGLDIAPLDENKLVVAGCDETSNNVEAFIYYTNGTVINNTITVDAIGTCDIDDNTVAITPLNSTLWVIAWFDEGLDDILFAVYDSVGSQITTTQTVDNAVGTDGRVDIDAINSTAFWIAYFDDGLNDIFYAKYIFDGTVAISPTTIAGQMDNEGDADNVAVATLNESDVVIAWNDDVGNQISFVVIPKFTTKVDIEGITNSQQVSASAFNETSFVIGYYQQGDDDLAYATFNYPSTAISGISKNDFAVGISSGAVSEDITIINSTAFVQAWYDDIDGDSTFRVNGITGANITDPIDADQTVAVKGSGVASQTQSSGIGFAGDNFAVAFINTVTDSQWLAFQPDGTSWDGQLGVNWSAISFDFGETDTNQTTTISISSVGTNPSVSVDCNGDCLNITSNWTTRTMSDGQSDLVAITCSNATEGTYNAVYNVTSDIDLGEDLFTVDCEVFSYGVLVVNLTVPNDNLNVTMNTTFEINATVNCTGGANAKCGNVNAFARFNDTTATPDTNISPTVGDTPFYIIEVVNISNATLVNQTDGFPVGPAGMTSPNAIDSNGSDFWIFDSVSVNNGFMNHFDNAGNNMSDGFPMDGINPATYDVLGMTVIDSDIWFIDTQTNFIYHTDLSGNNMSGGFSVNSLDIEKAVGLYTNISDFWIYDQSSAGSSYNVIHVNSTGGNLTGAFKTEGNGAFGMDSNGSDFWLVANSEDFVFHVDNLGNNLTDGFSTLFFGSDAPLGVVIDGTGFWIVDNVDDFVYHIDVGDKTEIAENPQTQAINLGDTFNASWTINATGANDTQWEVGVLFNSSFGTTNISEITTNNATVCIGVCPFGAPPAGDSFTRNVADVLITGDVQGRFGGFSRFLSDDFSFIEVITSRLVAIRTAFDNIVVTPIAIVFKVLFINVNDNLSITEVVSRLREVPRLISDTLSFTEVINRTFFAFRNLTDTISFTEVITKLREIFVDIDDNIFLTEVVNRATALFRSLSETLSFTEVVNSDFFAFRNLADSLSLTEVVARLREIPVIISDTLSFTEVINRTYFAFRNLAENLSFTEITAKLREIFINIDDNLFITDAIRVLFGVTRMIADTLSITDTADRDFFAFRSISDNLRITEVLNILRNTIISPVDELGITEVINRTLFAFRSLSDNLRITEVINAFRGLLVGVDDNLSITEVIARATDLLRTISDTLSFTEVINRTYFAFRNLSDLLSITEVVAKLRGVFVNIDDNLFINELISRFANLIRNLSDTILFVETVREPSGINKLLINIADALNFDIVINRIAESFKNLSDSLSFTEIVNRTYFAFRDLTDTLTFTEVVARLRGVFVNIDDNLFITEIAGRTYFSLRSLSDTLFLTEAINEFRGLFINIDDNLSITEAVFVRLNIFRAISDSFSITEVINRTLFAFRNLTDTLSLTEITAKLREIFVEVNDTLSIEELISRFSLFLRAISDTLFFEDKVGTTFVSAITSTLVNIADSLSIETLIERSVSFIRTLSDILNFFIGLISGEEAPPSVSVTRTGGEIRGIEEIIDKVVKVITEDENIIKKIREIIVILSIASVISILAIIISVYFFIKRMKEKQ